MSLPRQDVRVKLDYDFHTALVGLADADGLTPAEWAERELVRVIRDCVHRARIVHAHTVGLTLPGMTGDGRVK